MSKGVLYVVATPIGNLDDLTPRAVEILKQVDFIAAEDTRHTRPLLRHYAIDTPMRSLHQFNERAKMETLLAELDQGSSIALVSDAGTPLISDPGFPLVRGYAAVGGEIVPIPGASALACALSAAGLPTDRFLFAGFPPRSRSQRQKWLQDLTTERATLVFYEASHRVVESLEDMSASFGSERDAVIAREMTKTYETFLRGNLESLLQILQQDEDQRKGEFVILIEGSTVVSQTRVEVDVEQMLITLLAELPLKQAVSLASKVTGIKKNKLYNQALELSRT
ncbi:MAG: 16S rRNA (cytidine(1402)-2'-O)-methyltransferase [Candidatus Thiodiazotropha lotti]|uniref:Ribosomal RNA small subunit methyltransferase I n=1 Tax=Candidatus Thiodiazotropha endoloripes TaxID=1818881 RepID=A0A1E2UQM8_9GAMM|nr:16S rRNA (cytidine(1402)-2'-O)-methyltransferase [Candidatus Thiodiazotropha endoloripes]MCG7896915.1 16S rRNA (cytidine(1402)-2'-O)-methyltransferase [Candidatus Thiodiazotropha weberae]MCG7992621.1 16S rRNA (cytidine(1402)-2'-O)-methyltransferase [Candidatus Thiodiazotropha lotti]MCG7900973.1 16S rRNA (cytidine(1402)-2'-O)-methyltransferase [Candidatus Thiodiazotropha weberae]MCG7914258.1 16S rRNA (cytidine(1402)-2'-O)-methyltransferase [Candidatus Thiodiazotropha weberae]MCG8000062.1 16S